ncbi:MAG: DMT family transporter [Nitrospiria bacterium]
MIRSRSTSFWKTLLYTGFALTAFAANSVLGRIALGKHSVDASSFTIIRLLSGYAVLLLILKLSKTDDPYCKQTSRMAPLMLFLYAVTFSYAYIILDTGTGALILFGSVQLAIVFISLFAGERLHPLEWLGLLFSLAGFITLVLPGVTAPSLKGFVLMTTAGIAWGVYTLIGRKSKNPLLDTALNFSRTFPFVLALALFALVRQEIYLSQKGLLLAFASGGITSGIGYAVWYKALSGLSAAQAGVVQLTVPVIAAFGGVVFVSEVISIRLLVSTTMILGGIMVVFWGRHRFALS